MSGDSPGPTPNKKVLRLATILLSPVVIDVNRMYQEASAVDSTDNLGPTVTARATIANAEAIATPAAMIVRRALDAAPSRPLKVGMITANMHATNMAAYPLFDAITRALPERIANRTKVCTRFRSTA